MGATGCRRGRKLAGGLAVAAMIVTFAWFAVTRGHDGGYGAQGAERASSAFDMLRAVYAADDPRAAAEQMLRAAGEPLPTLLLPVHPPAPAPSSTSASAALQPLNASLTCYDAGDGSACNEPLPPDHVLQPFRQPDWGTSLCRKPVYPQGFDYLGVRRVTSYPLWSCDALWEIADHHALDVPAYGCPVDPAAIRCGDTVFLHAPPERLTDWLQSEHKAIRWPYIIVSCGFDTPVPFPDAAAVMLNQSIELQSVPKLWAWYGQNVGAGESGRIPRAHSLPAGLPSGGFQYGDFERAQRTYYTDATGSAARAALRTKLVAFLDGSWFDPRKLNRTMEGTLFASFSVANNVAERAPAADAAARVGSGQRYLHEYAYAAALKRALFVLAPGGVGMDVYRVTEAVVAGALPVLREHYWPVGYYDGWPRMLVRRWEDISLAWLRSAAAEALTLLDAGQFDFRRAYAPFQIARIRREQVRARAWCAQADSGGSS